MKMMVDKIIALAFKENFDIFFDSYYMANESNDLGGKVAYDNKRVLDFQ